MDDINYYKKKRKKNSYMDTFLKRRQQAVDFAVKGYNKSGCNYKKPCHYINENEDYLINQNKNKNNLKENNKYEKSYNNLKNDLIGETKSINSNYINDKENNNKKNKTKKINLRNYEQIKSDDEDLINFLSNEELNKNYQGNQNYSINISSEKDKTNNINEKDNKEKIIILNDHKDLNNNYYANDNNGFGNNLKIERINETNYYSNNKDIFSPPNVNKKKEYFSPNNKVESDEVNNIHNNNLYNIAKNKDTKIIKRNPNANIYHINNSHDKLYYYEGEENHKFYDSSGVNDYSYNYESYKIRKYYKINNGQNNNNSKNLSEPKYMKQKKIFDNINNKNKSKETSPIKNEIKCVDHTALNGDKQFLNGNSISNNNNNKLAKSCTGNINNINVLNSDKKNKIKNENIKNLDFAKVINESSNTKSISIIYTSPRNNNNIQKDNDIAQKEKEKEIVEIINDDKNTIGDSNKFYKQKSGKKKNKLDIVKVVGDDGNDIMIDYKYNKNVNDKHMFKKKRNESFLRQKEDEKEPNVQSIIADDISLNDDSIIIVKNKIVNNIKDKINIIKNNIGNNKENINYNNEIDNYYKRIKEKEKNNVGLNDYYQKISLKESKKNTNEYKKYIIQKSQRLHSIVNNIFDNKSRRTGISTDHIRYNNTNPSSMRNILKDNKKQFKIKRNKSNKEYMLASATDINLIVDQNDKEKIKIIDEKEYEELKNRNVKSSRTFHNIGNKLKDINNKRFGYKNGVNLNKYNNFRKGNFLFNTKLNKYFGDNGIINIPRSIWFYLEHRIMPPNEI